MSWLYYGIIAVYPFIAAIIAKFTISGVGIFKAMKEAYYLFFGYFLVYVGIGFIALALYPNNVDPTIMFIIFTIGYILIFIYRSYINTKSHDIFKKKSPEEKVGKLKEEAKLANL